MSEQSAVAGDPIVVAEHLHKTFTGPAGEPVVALDDVSLQVGGGEMAVVMGPSGAGKSTLLQVLAGLDRPDSGTVRIGGDDITRWGDRRLAQLRRRRLGFVFQSFNLVDSLTARENIALPVEIDGDHVDTDRLEALADSLGIVDRLDHLPGQLSGGQQQRVAVARALFADPDVVFADEPTGALDEESAQHLTEILLQVAHDHGHAVVAVSHDPNLAARGDAVYRLAAGRLDRVAVAAAL
ncbi:MAG: ABC transporter ATP-binding protein [Aeromicrobium sp.]|uniref:ABC transporter ATP-binding protein n=1 Tax=Aeromicrobium sp. TaxID=1871063 RepID=UPI0039E71004